MKTINPHVNRFGEKNISIPSHSREALVFEDEYGMTREEEFEVVDWSHDPRSESSHELHNPETSHPKYSDDIISQHAKIAMNLSPNLDSQFVELTVIDGCIYLDGFVQSRRHKKSAEACVENVYGVVDVFNRLNIAY